MRYHNYHKHTHYSNLRTLDCISKPLDYILRAKELGHTSYFTTEHGWGGNVWEAYTLCKEHGLKCIFGAEAYYVDNRFEKDKSNFHIIIVALNIDGYKDINRIVSVANTSGYYYKPRIDLDLLLSLNPNNVIVTTACIGGRMFKDDYISKFLLPVSKHFGDNFYLEVQSHNDPDQSSYNFNMVQLARDFGYKMIHANDSHYIKKEDSIYRDKFLKAKGIVYAEESNFILDYPSYDEIVDRYKIQGVLNNREIKEVLENTLVFDRCEDLGFNKDFKIPKISNNDSNKELYSILQESWDKEKNNIRIYKHGEYTKAIEDEFNTIVECGMSDYFVLNHKIVDRAVNKYNAILTRSGRGSGVSFYVNKLLGLTEVDRLKAPVTLYPSRFMTAERILNSKSLPDIDLNFADVEPVIKASKDILGEDGIYYMIAFKPLQESSAFRLWCKSEDMVLDEYNEVAKNLNDYLEDEYWKDIIEQSKVFRGVIESVAPSPCSFLLLDKPISQEIGLIKVGDQMCCCLDGYQCDQWKFLKNDFLTVTVYKLISDVYKELGRPIDPISFIVNNADERTWKLYRDGITATLNQADSDFARPLIMKYSPTNLAELSAWVGAIRPGFASLLNKFLNREEHTTGVDELDELLSDSYCYMLYQESLMKFFVWLNIKEKETYDIIKKIAKKKFKEQELKELKDKLAKNWLDKVGTKEGFDEMWQVVEDASRYSFNASHALSVAIDCLYGGYLKANYTLEYMTVALNEYINDIDRTNRLIKELDYFNITIKSPMFGYSKGGYFYNRETNTIYKGVGSIKYLNEQVGEQLYNLSQTNKYDNFIDLLIDIKEYTSCNSRQLEILVKLDYFSGFAKAGKLLEFIKLFDMLYGKKAPKKDTIAKQPLNNLMLNIIAKHSVPTMSTYSKFNSETCLKELWDNIRNFDLNLKDRICFQQQILGYIDYANSSMDKRYVMITDINTKYTPVVDTYCLNNSKTAKCKIAKKLYKDKDLKVGDIIYIHSMEKKFGYKKVGEDGDGKPCFQKDFNKIEWHITDYNVIKDIENMSL